MSAAPSKALPNLSYTATEEDLREAFSSVGTCDSVAVIMDRNTGQSRGFNGNADLVYRAAFSDGTQAILHAVAP